MKLKLRILQILAFAVGVSAWLYGASQKHQMPISHQGDIYIDKAGNLCSETDYRRGTAALRFFVGSWVVGAISTVGLVLLNKKNANA